MKKYKTVNLPDTCVEFNLVALGVAVALLIKDYTHLPKLESRL